MTRTAKPAPEPIVAPVVTAKQIRAFQCARICPPGGACYWVCHFNWGWGRFARKMAAVVAERHVPWEIWVMSLPKTGKTHEWFPPELFSRALLTLIMTANSAGLTHATVNLPQAAAEALAETFARRRPPDGELE